MRPPVGFQQIQVQESELMSDFAYLALLAGFALASGVLLALCQRVQGGDR